MMIKEKDIRSYVWLLLFGYNGIYAAKIDHMIAKTDHTKANTDHMITNIDYMIVKKLIA